MGGLFSALRFSFQSLSNFSTALSVINDNVANANTAGHTRKRVMLEPNLPMQFPYGPLGTGASISRIEGTRDLFLSRRLVTELQSQGFLQGQTHTLEQVESSLFNSQGEGVSEQITRFFDSFLDLTNDGSSLANRQAVLSEGANLVREFSGLNSRLNQLVTDNRQRIDDTVERINSLTERIARLNRELLPHTVDGQDGGSLQDQRQLALEELAQLIDFQAFENENGSINVTTASGKPLVLLGDSSQLSANPTASGVEILFEGQDVTADIQGGQLGGFLKLDRQTLPSFLADINLLAEELATQVNAIHASGQDLNGAAGQPFFTFAPGAAASTLAVNLSDASQVAAGAPGSGPGDVSVAQQLSDLRDLGLASLGEDTLSGFYSQVVFRAGLESRNVQEGLATQSAIVEDVRLQRESVSGVSLDEEAILLVQFQRSYEANSRVIRVIDELLEETMNLVG